MLPPLIDTSLYPRVYKSSTGEKIFSFALGFAFVCFYFAALGNMFNGQPHPVFLPYLFGFGMIAIIVLGLLDLFFRKTTLYADRIETKSLLLKPYMIRREDIIGIRMIKGGKIPKPYLISKNDKKMPVPLVKEDDAWKAWMTGIEKIK